MLIGFLNPWVTDKVPRYVAEENIHLIEDDAMDPFVIRLVLLQKELGRWFSDIDHLRPWRLMPCVDLLRVYPDDG